MLRERPVTGRSRSMWHHRRIIPVGLAVVTLLSGCLGRPPEVPRYLPPAEESSTTNGLRWDVWREARGHGSTIESLQSLRSIGRNETEVALIERANSLRTEAARTRDEESREILDQLPSEEDDQRRAVLTSRLADLVSTGLSSEEEKAATVVLDRSIDEWFAAGIAAMAEGRIERALNHFTWTTHAAADGRHPRRELESMVLARRLAGQQGSAAVLTPTLPPRVLAYTLDALVRRHVDRPSWRTLVDGGFATLEQRVRSEAGRSRILRLQRRFERSVASSEPTRFAVENALDELGAELADLTRTDLMESGQDGVRIFLEGMLATTDVRTDVFYGGDAATFRRMLDDSYVGIGTTLTLTPDGIELSPVAGGPARRAGVRRGDVLVAVDGTPTEELGMRGATERILGARGTEVVLSIRRGGRVDPQVIEDVEVRRDDVERELVHGWRQLGPDAAGRPLWDWIVDPERGIAYVGIREFTESTDRRFREALREANRELTATAEGARQVEGLIIDLRNNRGGRRDSTERILDLFLSTGALFETVDGGDRTLDRTSASPRTTRLDGLPVIVIVDEQSASAAEILAGTLQSRADALVVGERSYGKGSVQAVLPMRDGFLLVTESWFLVPRQDGEPRLVDRLRADTDWGILPDITSAATEPETVAFLAKRSDWNSGLDEDEFDFSNLPTLESTLDRPLLDAVILLRGRLGPRGTSPMRSE